MRGRPRKPTALRVLEGNPGKRPLPQNEPRPTGKAEMPGWLKPAAAVVWGEYAPRLLELGLLTDVDGETFGQWCTLAARFRSQGAKMPASHIARMDALASKFGLDPSSRARMGGMGKPNKPANPFQALTG
jgi:phage terminase small subunit